MAPGIAALALIAVGSLSMPASANAQTVAAGASHTVILKPDGTVWSFGHNGYGQLGDDTWTTRKSPIQVTGLTDVTFVAAGAYHSLALTSTGTLFAWGANSYGQLGDTTTTGRKAPVAVLLSSVVAVAAGEYHTIAVQANGDVYGFGYNWAGQLGTGNTTNTSTPILVASGGASVGTGIAHSLVVKTDGTAWSTGWNPYGQLGLGDTTNRTSFVQMSGVTTATQAAAGRLHSLLLLSNGTMKAAGYNGFGALGDGTTTQRTSPVSVSTVSSITAIAGGFNHSVARATDGTLWVWGGNSDGQVGDGTTTQRATPTAMTSLTSIGKVGAGHYHTVAVSATGVVSTWGRNDTGQLGAGTTVARSAPAAISGADYNWNVATPTLSQASGTYGSTLSVVVTVETPGATIHYTRDGVEPTEADAVVASGASLTVDQSQTLKAKAWKTLVPTSSTATAVYTLKVGTPWLSPSPWTYTSPQNVTFGGITSGATIRYTTNGTTPTESSPAYTGPIYIGTTTTIKAIGFKANWTNSDLLTGTYTINLGPLAAPTVTPVTGTYESSANVTMSSSQSGAVVRYTTDGSTPTASSTLYTAPVFVETTTTIKAKAFHPDYGISPETSRTYTITVAGPTFTPTGGSYAAGQTVTVATATSSATIRYTLTGVDPVDTDPAIVSGGTLVAGNYTLKAKAFKTGATASAVSSATYAVTGTVTTPSLGTGDVHSLSIRSDGVAWGWGYNPYGQVGDGTTTSPRLSPRLVAGVTGATAIDGGNDFSLLLKTDGTVVGFGTNQYGRLGDGTTTNRALATPVSGLTTATAIAAGDTHGVALKSDGTVVAWGSNFAGEIGDGTTTQRLTPTAVLNITNATAIAAGWRFGLARTQTGSVYAWGYNANGRLGDGTTTDRPAPVLVSGITTATAVAAGYDHGLAVLSDGTARAWGRNSSGQLGDQSTTARTSPVTVTGLTDITAVAAGQSHSLALKSDGTVWGFGANTFGQVGDGTTTDRTTAVQIPGLTDIVGIAAGQLHSLALASDSTVYVWGRNAQGQLGDGTTTDRLTPFAISGPGMNWRVPTPAISLAAGTYNTVQTTTITVADPEATIRYTTDGTEPTSSSATIASGGSLNIDQSVTIRASAWKTGALTSTVVSAAYVLQPAAPAMSPNGGAFTASQSVSITSSSPSVAIRYTTDGSEPTVTSALYASPIAVNTQTTVRARAFRDGWQSSAIVPATFTFNYGTLATPEVTPGSATYLSSVTVSITADSGASIRYTLNGSEPTEASTLYTGAFTVSSETVVKAKAFRVDYTSSTTRTVPYWTKVATPAVTPAAGAWPAGTAITATSSTAGAKVHYTIDGREPTTADAFFDASAPVYVGNFTLKTRAFLSGAEASDSVARAYTLTTAMSNGAVAAAATHSIALRPDGSVYGWGYNGAYRLLGVVYCSSQGTVSSNRPVASEVTAIKALDATQSATAAVRFDGTVVTWGANDYQQLGHDMPSSTCTSLDTADRPTARAVSGLTDIAAVDGGEFHFLALKADGTVWSWGRNHTGQLGNDTTTNTGTPTQVVGLTGVTMISAGSTHSLAVKTDGTIWAWGDNSGGQLGVSGGQRNTPVQVVGVSNPIAIAAGWNSSFAVLADGSVWIWGSIPSGLVPGAPGFGATAYQIPSLSDIASIATGSTATFALGEDGRVWAWGSNTYGQLGNNTTTARNTPDLVPDLPAIRGVSTAAHHALAVAADGSVWSWGYNAHGQVGDLVTGTDRLTPMVVLHADALGPVTMTTPGTYDPSLDVVRYYHTDAIGSVRAITDAAGAVVQRYDYKPFGGEWNTVTVEDKRRFTGQERDQETGLDYFGARHYVAGIGRFTKVDPVLDIERAFVDPQLWNRYTYVRNSPQVLIDPDGRQAVLASAVFSAEDAQRNEQVRTWIGSRFSSVPAIAGIVDTLASLFFPVTPKELGDGLGADLIGVSAGFQIGKVLPAISSSTLGRALSSGAETAGRLESRALRALKSHIDRGQAVYHGVAKSEESALSLIRGILSNPYRVAAGQKTVDIYNAAGQGVRLNMRTGEFITFLDYSKASR